MPKPPLSALKLNSLITEMSFFLSHDEIANFSLTKKANYIASVLMPLFATIKEKKDEASWNILYQRLFAQLLQPIENIKKKDINFYSSITAYLQQQLSYLLAHKLDYSPTLIKLHALHIGFKIKSGEFILPAELDFLNKLTLLKEYRVVGLASLLPLLKDENIKFLLEQFKEEPTQLSLPNTAVVWSIFITFPHLITVKTLLDVIKTNSEGALPVLLACRVIAEKQPQLITEENLDTLIQMLNTKNSNSPMVLHVLSFLWKKHPQKFTELQIHTIRIYCENLLKTIEAISNANTHEIALETINLLKDELAIFLNKEQMQSLTDKLVMHLTHSDVDVQCVAQHALATIILNHSVLITEKHATKIIENLSQNDIYMQLNSLSLFSRLIPILPDKNKNYADLLNGFIIQVRDSEDYIATKALQAIAFLITKSEVSLSENQLNIIVNKLDSEQFDVQNQLYATLKDFPAQHFSQLLNNNFLCSLANKLKEANTFSRRSALFMFSLLAKKCPKTLKLFLNEEIMTSVSENIRDQHPQLQIYAIQTLKFLVRIAPEILGSKGLSSLFASLEAEKNNIIQKKLVSLISAIISLQTPRVIYFYATQYLAKLERKDIDEQILGLWVIRSFLKSCPQEMHLLIVKRMPLILNIAATPSFARKSAVLLLETLSHYFPNTLSSSALTQLAGCLNDEDGFVKKTALKILCRIAYTSPSLLNNELLKKVIPALTVEDASDLIALLLKNNHPYFQEMTGMFSQPQLLLVLENNNDNLSSKTQFSPVSPSVPLALRNGFFSRPLSASNNKEKEPSLRMDTY
ncbi:MULTISPECIES: hypothetical protein [Legionella]|uniref:hypothetical protein n=1 Tax=Legionella TaxID=445 RepID=UPI000F8E1499|nr:MULTISPECIES: hypothetical protein [Legionella]MCP0913716.1 hypothetical protein [Legionella sp. 27cVA30]RUQ99333.1 hypothetical protein ELY11_04730 [Legionella septentrionalis]RUR14810.1 hypothetical protein ELY10_07630 [Legionella septentrionalis]